MKKRILPLFLLLFVIVFLPGSALAQTYSFSLDQETVNVFWNEDGTSSIDYVFVFSNDNSASPIDFVDVGLPNSNFDTNSIYADVDGQEITNISASDYQGDGDSGVAVGLGSYAIQPGRTGQVHVFIGTVRRMLRPDSQDKNYASGVFSPTWFGSQYVHGDTSMTVTFHFPPGVKPEEPRWHESPSGWGSEPTDKGIDDQGRIYYTWANKLANGYTKYEFGVSFPTQYIPANAIVRPNIFEMLGISTDSLIGLCICLGFIGIFTMSTVAAVRSTKKRKLQYLPPKIAIEGLGIKRGLTAVEAAILMEQPLDKVLTMILFAVIKKGAASVVTRDPLKLDVTSPMPDGLNPYEIQFLQAFNLTEAAARRSALQDMMVDLVKTLSTKMKGFSHKETLAYYRDIVQRAWGQVEAADTPEVKSQKFDEVMEWTMLDRDYDQRTRRVFTGPIFVPMWWGHYDPTFRPTPVSTGGTGGGGGVSLPHLPGSDFAASMVNSVQTFSGNVIGNLTDFTGKITNKTNPVPVVTSSGGSHRSSGGGGGHSCACACACAGCACACAGGGR
jgi:hypothetical protein